MSDSSSLNGSERLSNVSEKKNFTSTGRVADMEHLGQLEHFTDGSFTTEDIEIIAAHLDDRDTGECRQIVERALKDHKGDPAIGASYYDHLQALLDGPYGDQSEEEWETIIKFEAFLIHDWSIYQAVRSVTRPIDEEEFENYENIRVYILAVVWSCAGSVLATFFAVRFPAISLSTVALQILIAYTGKLFRYIPDFSFPVGFGRRCHFGGGEWNFKEQMLASCGMAVGNVAPYSQYVVIAMANSNFYGFSEAQGNFGFIVLLTLSTNLMGFGLAGLFRIFLVYPVRLIWFTSLPSIRLSRILTEAKEERENVNGWILKGPEFFWLFTVLFFGWYWITNLVFTFLAYFDWVAWISHNDNDMNLIAGVNSGLGVNPIPSFDPSIFLPTAMVIPYFSTVCILIGMVFSMLVIVGIYYMNISWTGYLPINDNGIYNKTGETFEVSEVLNERNNLDPEKYENYSMPMWTAGNLVVYGAFFAFYPAMIMSAILNYGEILAFSFKIFFKTLRHPRLALESFDDRFSRAQRKYKEVPEWWYLLFLAICLALGIVCVKHFTFTNTPVWTIFFGVGLSFVFMVPSGVLYAVTGQQVIINVLYELVIGLTIEGNGTALMISKAFATNFMVETDTFISNLKQGHYCGIAPRALFRIQIVNTIANSLVQSGLMQWQSMPDSIPKMCSPELQGKGSRFSCANQRTYFTAAVQWGTIGPRRVMTDLYPRLRWAFLAGALFPIPFWAIRVFVVPFARKRGWGEIKEGGSKFRNLSGVRYMLSLVWFNSFNELVFIAGCLNWAPYNFMYYWPWIYIGYAFQVYIPKYYPRWWNKFNYLLYASVSVGNAYAALIFFFATQYQHMVSIDWWGNVDGPGLSAKPRLTVPDGQTIGPKNYRA